MFVTSTNKGHKDIYPKSDCVEMIDAHVHLYPKDCSWRFYTWIEKKHRQKTTMPIEWDLALKKLDEMGVENLFNLTHAIVPDLTERLNEWQIQLKRRYGFIVFGAFHPKNDPRLLEEAFEGGIDGLKLHPAVQGFRPDSPEALKIYDLLEELKKPLCIHTGWFPDNGFLFSSPEQFEPLIYDYTFPVILAHLFHGKIESVRKFFDARKNVYGDASNVMVDFTFRDKTGKIMEWRSRDAIPIIEEYSDRVMYGSEIPLIWWRAEQVYDNLIKYFDDRLCKKLLNENAAHFVRRHLSNSGKSRFRKDSAGQNLQEELHE